MTLRQTFIILFGLATIAAATPAYAGDPKLLATEGKWSAYSYIENKKKVCYILSQPQKAEGKYKAGARGEIYALITNRPADGSKNVFSYIAGYPYKPGSDVTVKIDSQSFTLFTQDDTAWAPDAATDTKIAEAMSKGSSMVVTGVSARGTDTTDTFSLEGSGASHKAMVAECDAKD